MSAEPSHRPAAKGHAVCPAQAEGLAPVPPTAFGCVTLQHLLLAHQRAGTSPLRSPFAPGVQLPGGGSELQCCGKCRATTHRTSAMGGTGPPPSPASGNCPAAAGDCVLQRQVLSEVKEVKRSRFPRALLLSATQSPAQTHPPTQLKPFPDSPGAAREQETTVTCWLPVLVLVLRAC